MRPLSAPPRPIYETPEDRSREDRVRRTLERHMGVAIRRTPPRYPVDGMAIRDGRVVGWVEIKVRRNLMRAYPTFMLSLSKAMAARSLREVTGLPTIVAVEWADATGFARLDQTYPVYVGGRRDRGDPQDIEPVIQIGIDNFTTIRRQ